jgi:hypothetical protein
MTSARRLAYAAVLVASLLLAADLFLTWQSASVRVGDAVVLDAGSSGWDGPGFVAGIAALVAAALSGTVLARGREHPRILLGAALTALAATALAAFAEGATVVVPEAAVAVQADSTRWPAWVGLGLAVVAAGAALVAHVPQEPTSSSESSRSRRWASGS